jgi:hypothetical protein
MFKVILLTYPKVIEDSSSSKKEDQRPPMTGTIDEVGDDVKRIKDMGVEHTYLAIVFYLRVTM